MFAQIVSLICVGYLVSFGTNTYPLKDHKMFKKILLSLFASLAFSFNLQLLAQSPTPKDPTDNKDRLKIASFNIEWFGLNGSLGGIIGEESRDQDIKKFMKKYGYFDHDVIVFQEIVDVDQLKTSVLDSKFKCKTYNHKDSRHQHVVICYKPKYNLSLDNDDNYQLESVTVGSTRLRPAMHGILKRNGKSLVRIIGVHLKAIPSNSDRRIQQVEQIANHLDQVDSSIPTVVTGDFNSFHDDVEQFSGLLEDFDLLHVPHLDEFTFRTNRYKDRLDHFWASSSVSETSVTDAFDTCSNDGDEGRGVSNRPYYNDHISDHCPISTEINL